ncbi:hypothetical protein [Mycobacterium sp.]|uniref:hypothetical protein n=1 Tax=Mycobacterium sp. TaxID=1785 RepID=UPI003D10292A
MNIRRIAVVGSFVAGAALAFAPLAAADDLTTTVDSEIASLNSLFESEVAVAGDTADLIPGGTGVLDTIPLADAPDAAPLTTLDYELYGPWANSLIGGLDSAPGAQDVLDGAVVEFDDAYNTFASLLFTTDSVIPATDLIGVADAGLDTGSLTDAALFASFINTGLTDLVTWFTSLAVG